MKNERVMNHVQQTQVGQIVLVKIRKPNVGVSRKSFNFEKLETTLPEVK